MSMIRWAAALLIITGCCLPVYSQEKDSSKAPELPPGQPMSLERMEEILLVLDPDTQSGGTRFLLSIEEVQLFVMTDPDNDRMRIIQSQIDRRAVRKRRRSVNAIRFD